MNRTPDIGPPPPRRNSQRIKPEEDDSGEGAYHAPFAGNGQSDSTDENVGVPISEATQTVVLACYLATPTAFANQASELPKLFTGLRRDVALAHNALLVSLPNTTPHAAFQEVFEDLRDKDREELEELQGKVAAVNVAEELPYIQARLPKWIHLRLEDLAACDYFRTRAELEKNHGQEAQQAAEEAKGKLVHTLMEAPCGLIIEGDRELSQAEIPESEPVIQGLLDAGMLGLFGASSKSYKTWVSLMLALGVAYTGRWLGFKCHKGKVLYLNFELTRKAVQKRIDALYKHYAIESTNEVEIVQLKGADIQPEALLRSLILRCKLRQYRLIIIDPLYVFEAGRVENSNDEMGDLMLKFIGLAVRTGTAVWVCHHYSKGNQALKELLDRFAGAGALGRAIDSAVGMTPLKADKAYGMEFVARNHEETEAFAVRWEYPVMVEDESLDPKDLKPPTRSDSKKFQDSDFIAPLKMASIAGKPLSGKEWKKTVVESTGMNEKTFDRRKKELIAGGRVTCLDDGYIPSPSKQRSKDKEDVP